MLSEQFIIELDVVLKAQNHLLQQLDVALSEVEMKLADVDTQASQIDELEQLMRELETEADWLDTEDFNGFDPTEIIKLYERRHASITQELTAIGYQDWHSFVKHCYAYSLTQEIDPLLPYESLLTENDLQRLHNESYDAQLEWDKWDYIFVGASGILAALTDCLLVRIPTTIVSGQYAGQQGSPLTEWLKQYDIKNSDDWFAQWARSLEKQCKVPYDFNGSGMGGKSHRSQSIGHDPVLGFIFGVYDILHGTVTGFSYDKQTRSYLWVHKTVKEQQDPIGLVEAMLRHIGHLVSDVATPMGLPAPFMTLIQGVNVGSFGEKERTVGQLAKWMYANGYDFRHFLVSGITPATIEIILRAYIMLRHYSQHGATQFNLSNSPKYRTMLTVAHGIAAFANAGKVAVMQGNPLAINYAEWLAFIRYLMPTLKYWMFDHQRLRLEHMQRINDAGWNQLLHNGDNLLELIAKTGSQTIELGKASSH